MLRLRWVTAMCFAMCVGLVAMACESPQSTVGVSPLPSFSVFTPIPGNGIVDDEQGELCKVDGPVDGTWFNIDIKDKTTGSPLDNYDVQLLPGECLVVWGGGGATEIVTVTETVPTGYADPMWEKTQCVAPAGLGDQCRDPAAVLDVTNGVGTVVTGEVGGDGGDGLHEGVLWTFTNSLIPGGGEGCTPGYWKNHTGLKKQANQWPPTGFGQGDSFDATFGVVSSFGGTLLEALNRGGGGEMALGRHAVAALLNAAHPDVSYDLSVMQVITDVQAAYASGDFEATKDVFAAFNEQGCPIGARD